MITVRLSRPKTDAFCAKNVPKTQKSAIHAPKQKPGSLINQGFRASWSIGDSKRAKDVPGRPILYHLVTLCCHITQVYPTTSHPIPHG